MERKILNAVNRNDVSKVKQLALEIKQNYVDLMGAAYNKALDKNNIQLMDIINDSVTGGANIGHDGYFILAASKGYLYIVKYFVEEKGVNPSIRDDQALILASENGHLDVVDYLVQNRTNINARNGKPLYGASIFGHLDVVDFLLKNGANINKGQALIYAAGKGYLDIVKLLHSYGADLNSQDGLALLYAISNDKNDMVKYLVENGAISKFPNTALINAAVQRNLELFKYLVENGYDIYKEFSEIKKIAELNFDLKLLRYLRQFERS